MKNALKKAVKAREIRHLLHFTRLANLESILEHGLVGRSVLEESVINHVTNDAHRFDLENAAVCCSIGHPNYKLFYPFRLNNPDDEWVVLAIKRVVIWSKSCAFCTTNAASNSVTSIPIQERQGFHPFVSMFNEQEDAPSREELGIPDRCPTDPQAEVLVLEPIEPKYIIGAMTNTERVARELRAKHSDFEFKYIRTAFQPRKDYKHWQ